MAKSTAEIYYEKQHQRLDFDVNKFNSKIYQKGINISWEKMLICPCRKDATSQAVSDCINCRGSGYYWFDKLETKALISGASLSKNYINWSEVLEGSIYVSVDSFYKLGWYDKITVLDAETVFSEKKKIILNGITKQFELNYEPTEIIKAMKFISSNVVLQEIDVNNLTINGKTLVVIDNNVNENDNVSILYKYKPTYLIVDLLNDYRNTYVKNKLLEEKLENAPIRILAKKLHLVI